MRLHLLMARTLLRARRSLCAVCSLVLLVVFSPAHVPAQSPGAARIEIETLPPATLRSVLANGVDYGQIPASQPIQLTLTLAQTPARAAALDRFLTDVQTASSPRYRRWLTPAEFGAEFGADADQLAAAIDWLQSQGLSVQAVSPSGLRLTATGLAAQIEAALLVDLHTFRIEGRNFDVNLNQPSLPAAAAALFTSIEGLAEVPADFTPPQLEASVQGLPSRAALVNGSPSPLDLPSLAAIVDGNATPIVTIAATFSNQLPSASYLSGLEVLFRQAAAQGITTLLTQVPGSGGFPSGLPEVTVLALPAGGIDLQTPFAARPGWQSAAGLPEDSLRHAPDVTVSDPKLLASALASIALRAPGERLGNINPVLYSLATTPDLYTQPDHARAGTWEAATGLGLVDLRILEKAYPLGSGQSYVSLAVAPAYFVNYGTALTFTSAVTSGTGGTKPSGTVSYQTTGGVVVCGPVTLDANGNTTCTTSTLAVGSYQIVASYSGDATYAGAQSSPPAGVTVAAPNATLSGVVSSGNVVGGTFTATITATVPSGAGSPTGNITLNFSGTSTSYTQPLVAQSSTTSSATFTEPAGTVGTLTINATCSGGDINCPNQYTGTVTIAKATPGLTISYTPNPPVSGQTINLTATLTAYGTAPVPTGTVTFYDNGIGLNSAAINANGQASTTGVVPTASSHSITAIYNGDANYLTATASGSSSSSPTPTVSLTTSNGTPAVGASVTLTAAVSGPPGSVIPQGTVTFTDSVSGTLGQVALANGLAALTTTALPSGTSTVVANYGGSSSYNPASSNAVTEVTANSSNAATVTTAAPSVFTVSYGETYTLTASVQPAATSNATPTGTVNFSLGGVLLQTVSLSAGGKASFQLSAAQLPSVGSYSYTAAYSGDATFGPSTGASAPITVVPAVASIVATVNPLSVGTGMPATVSVTVTLANAILPPLGSVSVTVPGVPGAIYSGTLTASSANTASATISVPAPPAGTYQLQVACAANANFVCAPATVLLTSTAAPKILTTTTLTVTPASPVTGQAVLLTATIASAASAAAPISGTVSFYSGTTLIGSATVANNIASASFVFTGTTPQTLTALYAGDSNYASSMSAAVTVTPNLAPVSVVLSTSSSSGLAGATILVTAKVSGVISSGAAPTGTVSFYLGSAAPVLLGTAKLSSIAPGTSIATFNVVNLPAGAQSVYAVYAGDTNFAPGVSASIAVSISDYSFTFTPATLTLRQGQTGSVILLLNAAGGFSGTVALSCAPPPNDLITCSLSQSSLPATGAGPSSVVLTIGTLAASAENRQPQLPAGWRTFGGASLAALLCFLLSGVRRRRLPGVLLLLLAFGLIGNLGCSSSSVARATGGSGGGTPLGTVFVTVNTASLSGTTGVAHDYSYQVTVVQ